jgi:hypothetical protein
MRGDHRHLCMSMQVQGRIRGRRFWFIPMTFSLACPRIRSRADVSRMFGGRVPRTVLSRALDMARRKLGEQSMPNDFFLRVQPKHSLHHPCARPYHAMFRPYQLVVHRASQSTIVHACCPIVLIPRWIRREYSLRNQVGDSRGLVKAERARGCHGGLLDKDKVAIVVRRHEQSSGGMGCRVDHFHCQHSNQPRNALHQRDMSSG